MILNKILLLLAFIFFKSLNCAMDKSQDLSNKSIKGEQSAEAKSKKNLTLCGELEHGYQDTVFVHIWFNKDGKEVYLNGVTAPFFNVRYRWKLPNFEQSKVKLEGMRRYFPFFKITDKTKDNKFVAEIDLKNPLCIKVTVND